MRFIEGQRILDVCIRHRPSGNDLPRVQIYDAHFIRAGQIHVQLFSCPVNSHGLGVIAGQGDVAGTFKGTRIDDMEKVLLVERTAGTVA